MTTQSDMALLAADAYRDIRNLQDNQAPISTGWTELTEYAISGSGGATGITGSGFSARVYRDDSTGKVVISYAGTEFAAGFGALADFTSGNIPMALGQPGMQAALAADLYQRVKANPALSDDITFTGHSLGGGLASVMAVWFDRPAYVFAPAPFELSATRADFASTLSEVRSILRSSPGGIDPAFDSYQPDRDFAAREAKVRAWAVKGEVLESALGFLNWVEASSIKLFDAGVTELGMLPKHSIDLHAAGLLSSTFNEWAAKLPTALPLMFDSGFYGANPLSLRQDFLIKLVRNEVGVPGFSANGMLGHFSADLRRIGQEATTFSDAAKNTLIAHAIESYYWQGSAYAGKEFFAPNPALLQYTTAQNDQLAGAENRAGRWADQWLAELATAHGVDAIGNYYAQWNVATGATGATANARDDGKTQLFIGGNDNFTGGSIGDTMLTGAGADTLIGGGGNDRLMGAAGADSLEGGAGNDRLYGGAGNDTYRFSGAFGGDAIIDSDGSGLIEVDGQPLTGADAKRVAAGVDAWSDDNWVYSLMDNGSGGKDLIVQRDSSLNQLRIRNWSNGQLGINLGNEVAASVTTNVFTGDLIKTTDASGLYYLLDSNGNYLSAGTQPGAADLVNGSGSADSITGGGGNDGLAGSAGDDVIDGGAGDDVLLPDISYMAIGALRSGSEPDPAPTRTQIWEQEGAAWGCGLAANELNWRNAA
jgi:hypothetical protein